MPISMERWMDEHGWLGTVRLGGSPVPPSLYNCMKWACIHAERKRCWCHPFSKCWVTFDKVEHAYTLPPRYIPWTNAVPQK